MPVVTFDYNDFIELLGYQINKEELIERLPMIGADFDKAEGDNISIEFFPNRPDLSSVEGLARASRAFFGFKTGLQTYDLHKSDIKIHVDPSVKNVRPFVQCALVTDVTMTDELISSLMELQEKLHFGIGRNRKKIAIGVHNYEPVQPPFTYKAVDPYAVQFVPLAKTESMTLEDILTSHEKGVAYAHLLKDADQYPLIVDKNDNVLSFPPIINGTLTEVTPFTTDLFIDVTGTSPDAIRYALNIVTTALAERGGKIHTTTIIDEEKTQITPNLTPSAKPLSITYANNLMGTTLNAEEIITCLEKMGYNATQSDDQHITTKIPAWRTDILHEIDLIEDVCVGYGFDTFTLDMPKTLTFGKKLPTQDIYDTLQTIMIGLGFNEVTTFTISNEKDEFNHMGLDQTDHVQIKNPIGEEYSCLRVSLLPSLLKLLAENKHHSLPQQVFELGIIVDETFKNKTNLSGIKVSAKANFTESKSIAEAIMREIGKDYDIKEKNHPAFIPGRCAALTSQNQEIGFFGELHPKIIKTFDLEHPTIAFEIYTDQLII
ncbi:MAG: phenylalanine--tRNA ligase subunit beta [Thermoplasmatota archaeon]